MIFEVGEMAERIDGCRSVILEKPCKPLLKSLTNVCGALLSREEILFSEASLIASCLGIA